MTARSMLMPATRASLVVLAAVCATVPLPAADERVLYLDVPIQVTTPVRPRAFRGDDGRVHLVYHLFLTNWGVGELE